MQLLKSAAEYTMTHHDQRAQTTAEHDDVRGFLDVAKVPAH